MIPMISMAAAAAAKSLQSSPTLCDPIDSPLGSSIHGLFQARVLEWVAITTLSITHYPFILFI